MSAIEYPVGFTDFNVSYFLCHEINQEYYCKNYFWRPCPFVKLNGRQIHFRTNSSKFAVVNICSSTVIIMEFIYRG